ncbi:MAG: class I SAM-dependent methyltransferase [Verrucomicrobia bacterium]|nr:class I SAM-dependent methyltransferase [Verrucomicrobiota bacterium]MBS0646383.1 class I SAM-dependent methyltransferase [Verrucomicrobiota bacterium]
MGQEINLLEKYPRSQRNTKERGSTKTEEDRAIARQYGKDFFDGDRKHGYGGFSYHPRFWVEVVKTLKDFYQLTPQSSVLDIGCAKGFMLHDLRQEIPNIHIKGIDISEYAIHNCMEGVRPFLCVADCRKLPFPDASFDLVVSINTVHNLEKEELKQSLQEIMRVTRKHAFITVDAYRNDEEKETMFDWALTARTILHTEEWKLLFKEAGYEGDYYWFIP